MESYCEFNTNLATTSDGVRIRYIHVLKKGSNATIVFIHGIGGDATAWAKEQEIAYKQGYSSVAIDLRGHGLSDNPLYSESYLLEILANDVTDVISALKLKNVILVGHSFGSMVSLVVASKGLSVIKKLILVSARYQSTILGKRISKITNAFASLLRWFAYRLPQGTPQVRSDYSQFVGTPDLHLKRLISDIQSTSLRNFLLSYYHLFRFDGTTILESIDLPTLILCGEKDIIAPPKIANQIAGRIKNAKLEIIPNTNHIIVISNPEELMNPILDFTKDVHYLK